jgi:serine/threonine protein kinase
MNPRESEFEKKDKLGAGSFGTVWRVQRRSDGALFAMKEIDLRKPGMQHAMKEVETMTALPPHRNVVRLHEHWKSKDGKDMWLLLEYCSQGTLAQFLFSTARLPDAALWDLSGQLLQALLLFERHRIVHNDIKPENIFIMEGSIPKIGDLGLARFTSVGSVLSKMPGGTPLFQAPEVLSKDTSSLGADGKPFLFPEYAACEVSYQSDVYSVGAVIWSMVMRRNPDRPGGAFPLTPALVPDSSLRKLVNDMLQPDPAKRPRASHLVLRFTATGSSLVSEMSDEERVCCRLPRVAFRCFRLPRVILRDIICIFIGIFCSFISLSSGGFTGAILCSVFCLITGIFCVNLKVAQKSSNAILVAAVIYNAVIFTSTVFQHIIGGQIATAYIFGYVAIALFLIFFVMYIIKTCRMSSLSPSPSEH